MTLCGTLGRRTKAVSEPQVAKGVYLCPSNVVREGSRPQSGHDRTAHSCTHFRPDTPPNSSPYLSRTEAQWGPRTVLDGGAFPPGHGLLTTQKEETPAGGLSRFRRQGRMVGARGPSCCPWKPGCPHWSQGTGSTSRVHSVVTVPRAPTGFGGYGGCSTSFPVTTFVPKATH